MTAKSHPSHWKFQTIHEDSLASFKDIPGTGGTYKISADGVVVSSRHRGLRDGWWIVLRCTKSKNSRPFARVCLYMDGSTKPAHYQLSRLLLETFVGPPPTALHVAAHRNGITDDDRLENLVWSTSQEVKHAQICRGTWAHGERTGHTRFTREQVEAARKIVIEFGVPADLLANAMGESQSRIREWLVKTWDTDRWDGLQNPLTIATG